MHRAAMNGGVGRIERRVERSLLPNAARDALDMGDQLGRRLHRIDAVGRQRRMAFAAPHMAAEGMEPLLPGHRHHAGRLADQAGERFRLGHADLVDQARYADAADLLVIGKGEMDGPRRRPRLEFRNQRQRGRDEALHVGGAAAIEAALILGQHERIGRPILVVDRHHVGVARQDQPAAIRRPDRGEQIGLAPVVVEGQPRGDAEPVQIVADELDRGQVGIAADRVETDQPPQYVPPIHPRHRATRTVRRRGNARETASNRDIRRANGPAHAHILPSDYIEKAGNSRSKTSS